jgi:septal ring factor EnvC (AmiA/AmiB activator)
MAFKYHLRNLTGDEMKLQRYSISKEYSNSYKADDKGYFVKADEAETEFYAKDASLEIITKHNDELLARIKELEEERELAYSHKSVTERQNKKLRKELAKAEETLKHIANADYRGNRSSEITRAQNYFKDKGE